jgi:hypothetical protein
MTSSDAVTLLTTAEYLEIRPIFPIEELIMTSALEDYVCAEVQFGGASGLLAGPWYIENVENAVDWALTIKKVAPSLRLRYSGYEGDIEFSDWRSFLLSLAQSAMDRDDSWYLAEQVALGAIAPDDPAVVEFATHDPILAAAIASGTL